MTTKRFLIFILPLLFLFSCGEPEEQEPEPTGFSCKPCSFAQIAGWRKDAAEEVYDAFALTCARLAKSETEFLGEAELKIKRADYLDICQKLPEDRANFQAFLEENFQPCLVRFDGDAEGKFTSYYEAEIHASTTRSDKYNVPIYGRPNDLIEFNPHDFDKTMPSKRLVGRVADNRLVPYFARAEIVSNGIDAPVILWGDSYIDIYVMQIQGSAVAKLEDGSKVRIGFADTNGRAFKGIGSILLEHKAIRPGQASMGKIKKWLKENPYLAQKYLDKNQRYVFHRLSDAEGPLGALGVPLTAGRSLAVDKKYIPLGTLLWLETTGPEHEPIEKLVIAQDIGGAIKGAVRGDYFWGSGGDDVLEMAGKMHAKGRYFALIPKNEGANHAQETD